MKITSNSLPTSGKIPTFLGIDIECDPDYQKNLLHLFSSAFTQAGEPKNHIDELKHIVATMKPSGDWKLPNTHHVTTMFIGGNKSKLKEPGYVNFQEGAPVDIEIRAIVYVPDKLIAGICFPQAEVENEFPHLTLMVSQGWAPVMSNAVIKATCAEGKPFENAYDASREGLLPAKGAGVHTENNVAIEKKGKNEVVFVLLREPVLFKGKKKAFY